MLYGAYDSAYFSPMTYTPSSTGRVYLKVAGDYTSSNGAYAIKYEAVTGSKIQLTVAEDTTSDFGSAEIAIPVIKTYTINNYYGVENILSPFVKTKI